MKKCKRCEIEKDIIYFSKCIASKDGLNSWCKDCKRTYSINRYNGTTKKTTGYKKCSNCNIEKYVISFSRGSCPDGLNSWCKDCHNNYNKKYYMDNRDRLSPIRKSWKLMNLDNIKKYQKNRYYEIDKERLRNYYLENKNDIRLKSDLYKKTDGYKSWITEYRIKNNWRNRYRGIIRSLVKRIGYKKEGKTIDILGYSAIEFKKHIESRFVDDMSWDKRDSFHIDHIVPVSDFIKNTPVSIINALDNLRPLAVLENLKKHNSIDFVEIDIYLKYIEYLNDDYRNIVLEYIKTSI